MPLPGECADEPATAAAHAAGGGRLSVRWSDADTLPHDLRWLLHQQPPSADTPEESESSCFAQQAFEYGLLLAPEGLPSGLRVLLGVDVEGHSDLVQLCCAHRAVLFRLKPLLPPLPHSVEEEGREGGPIANAAPGAAAPIPQPSAAAQRAAAQALKLVCALMNEPSIGAVYRWLLLGA